MTTYKTTTYETAEDLRNAIETELEALAYPYAVKHRTFGDGQLTFIKVPATGGSLFATIDFTSVGTKTLGLDVTLANNLLEMPEILTDILLEAQTAFKADFIERETAQLRANIQAREEAKKATKQAEADKKNEEKYERTKARILKDFESLTLKPGSLSTESEFYYSLGWLAKNTTSFAAAMPDYLLPYFEKHFGTDYKPKVVDSKKKTVNGFPMQWALSMNAAISTKANNMPTYLTEHLSQNGKQIADTSFIWDLVDKYGFQFGKKQNIDEIRSHIPSACLGSFEAGLAA